MAGYSGVPLTKKLGILANSELVIINEPQEFRRLIKPISEGVRVEARVTKGTDMVHIFATSKNRLSESLQLCVKQMARDAVIWVSWPKKSSQMRSDVSENVIREIALPLGLVDIKVCAIDETWSGLKLVIRKEKRKAT